MSITLELRPELETRLRADAARAGVALDQYVVRQIEQTAEEAGRISAPLTRPVPVPGRLALGFYPAGSLAEAFAQWQAEDATDDPGELRRAEEELDELKANLNANRAATGERPLFP